jgi:hypothetical protein
MANILTTSNPNMLIKWVKRYSSDGEKLCLTLCTKTGGVIGKANMMADYIKDYILINSMPEAKKIQFAKLYKELENLLYDAPEENNCTPEEADMYAEMANLYNSMSNYIDIQKIEGAL